jgi:Xaa-Pro aminopeptidase
MSRDNLLIVADSEHNADMLYAVGVFVPERFIFLRHKGRPHVVLADPELDRVRRLAPQCRVLSYSRYERRAARAQGNGHPPGLADVLRGLLRERRIRRVVVGEDFPFGLARRLRRDGVKVKLAHGALFPDRIVKGADEVKKISAALVMAEVGLAEGLHALRRTRPKDGRLYLNQNPLTAERLRAIMDTAMLEAGGTPGHTIVAAGRQSCDPHERGHGPLPADAPIVLDVFPRSQKTGYHGDITRTVVRGRASEPVRAMHAAVVAAQQAALARLRHGAWAEEVHTACAATLAAAGFATRRRSGRHEGFIHSAGHGIGLELHEAPRLAAGSADLLAAGQVVTLEPGLYYPGVGGVRLEDVALVTRAAPRNLTKFETTLEI